MSKNWHYASNQFEVVTNENTKLLAILAPDHQSRMKALAADAIISSLNARTEPLTLAFNTSYQNWLTANGVYRGATLAFENMLSELLKTKIKKWDILVQVEYIEGTPEYISIFPKGRAAFNSGPYDVRINEVKALGDNLAAYASLAAVKTEVDTEYVNLLNARNTQQQKEELVREKSSLLATAKKNMCNMMYANLGILMDKYNETPEQIEMFFELELIMKPPKEKNTFSGTVAGGDTVNILEGGFDDNTEFQLYNSGDTTLLFFTATSPTITSGDGFKLEPKTNATVLASSLGQPGNTCLNVFNVDASNQGSWSVIIA